MQYLEVTVETSSAGIETVAECLTAAGFDSLVLEDQAEFETFLDENRAYWDYIDEDFQKKLQGLSHIRLYFAMDGTEDAELSRLKSALTALQERNPKKPLGTLSVQAAPMPETDWSESWKDNYPPQEVGENLVVLPYWLADTYEGGRTPIILDPGLTFGTGNHPTTQMVLREMEQYITKGCACLDLGSGSGILSLAALRLGAGSAVGVDIDPKAEDIARENAAYNGFAAPMFTAYTGSVTADKKLMDTLQKTHYDVVLINIVADVILALCPVLPRFAGAGTKLILSGILDSRLEEVLAGLKNAGLSVYEVLSQEQWRCVCAGKEPQ